jgi:DNA-binding CsgD family transcriptional regulator/tetratricopeptide (TPR) repeat protein
MLAYDFDLVEDMAGKALAIADELGRHDIRCHALNNLGLSKVWSDPESGRQLLDESLAIALEINSIDDAGRAYVNYAHFEYRRHNYRRLIEIANEGLDYNSAKELDSYYRYLKGTLSWAYLRLGDWKQAETLARESYERAPPGNQFNHVRFPAALTLAKLEMRRGTGGEAPYFDFLYEFGRRYPELQRLTPIAAAIAERSWVAGGDHTAAIEYIEPIVLGVDACYVAEALIWLKRLKPETPVQASTKLLPVDRSQLDGEYEQAADTWLEIGSAFEAAMALASGNDPARRKAVELFDTLGANASAQRLREYARELGEGIPEPRLSTRTNPAGLTRRQMEVLQLLGEGHSNSKIAEKLFVSPKTIDHHVSAILAKLDASTRSEAAAIARKRGMFSD